MVKTLQKYGNSHALVIDKPLMEAMGITAETPLNITVSSGSLSIQRADVGLGPDRVHATLSKLRPKVRF